MTIGPTEYIIVGFPENQFTGQIAPALADLIDNDTIRILDLVFISKDADGDVTAFEYDELDELAAFGDLDGEVGGLIGPDDIAHAAEGLDPNSSAALLIWEDTWAIPLVEAMRSSGGVLLEGGRIPHDLAEEAFAGLASAGA
jgi:Family of unknown function (DUF6325)